MSSMSLKYDSLWSDGVIGLHFFQIVIGESLNAIPYKLKNINLQRVCFQQHDGTFQIAIELFSTSEVNF